MIILSFLVINSYLSFWHKIYTIYSTLPKESTFIFNKENAIKYFKNAFMLYYSDGIEIDKKEAAKYFKMATNKGNILSTRYYTKMLYNGERIEVNMLEVDNYYIIAS